MSNEDTLVIIESPGKKEKITEYLGAGHKVLASFGHVRDMPTGRMAVAAPDYDPEYVDKEEPHIQRAVAALKAAVKKARRVILATDRDREGEAIAWHLSVLLGLENPQRMTYQEVTPKALKHAMENLRPIDMNLVRAQEGRRVLDRLIGYRVSDALQHVLKTKKLSAGRVQSPALRLVVELEREILAFEPTTYYGVKLQFNQPAPWAAEWQTVAHLRDGAEYMRDEPLCDRARSVRRLRVADFAETKSKKGPPAPFTTVTLMKDAQKILKIKPAEAMKLAQNLYEQASITYMRTDSPNLSDDAYNAVVEYAKANALPLASKRRVFKSKEGAQEGHEAIRPTHLEHREAGKTEDEKALYRLIWARTIASQLAEAVYAVRVATLTQDTAAPDSVPPIDGDIVATYVATGRTLVDKGWTLAYEEPEAEDTAAEDEAAAAKNPVPLLAVGQQIDADNGVILNRKTTPPKRLTQVDLILLLEKHGIGRPATYPAILKNILDREYIAESEKGFLCPLPLGERVVDSLIPAFKFLGLEYTRDLETGLDDIAEGKRSFVDVVTEADNDISSEIVDYAPGYQPRKSSPGTGASSHPCPACQKPMFRREGPKGPFWACSNRADCGNTLPDDNGKPGARKEKAAASASPNASAHKCADASCGKPLRRTTKTPEQDTKNGKGFDFFGCTGWPNCTKTYKVSSDGTPIY